jgi:hypothetical protein
MSAVAAPLVPVAAATRRRTAKRTFTVGLAAVLLGAVAGPLAADGQGVDLIALLAIFVLVAVWMRPQLGPVLLLLVGLLIEQFPIGLTNGITEVGVPITQGIPMFQGLGSVHLDPSDLFPVVIFTIYMIRSAETGGRWWPRTQLSVAVAAVIGAVLFGEVYGVAHHGVIRESLFECRPFIYFGLAYLVTSVIIRTRTAVYAMLWAVVVAEILKSLQGLEVWIVTRGWKPEPQNVLGHEEAMFFGLFFLVVAALWMFNVRGRLRTVGTWAVPLVLFANMVNDRRAAWLVLGSGLVTIVAVGYRVLPHRRRVLGRLILITAAVTAVYLPAYWNHTDGTLGKPADAVRSEFSPTARDALSNEYRVQEDANLKLNILDDGLTGAGFGLPINYALPMPGLVTAQDAAILYVPHNSVLYVLMRMGIVGGVAFWAMLGAAIIAGCRLAKCPDRLFAAVGTIGAAAVVGWALEGAVDLGFTFLRIAIVMGCVVGLVEASRHIHTDRKSRRSGFAPSPGSTTQKSSPLQVVH